MLEMRHRLGFGGWWTTDSSPLQAHKTTGFWRGPLTDGHVSDGPPLTKKGFFLYLPRLECVGPGNRLCF